MTEAQYKAQILYDLGDRGVNAIFELTFPVEATGGTWALSFAGASSAPLNRFYTPSTLAALKSALEAVETIGAGNVEVAFGTRGYQLEFIGELATQSLPSPEVDGSDLTPAGIVAVSPKQIGRKPFFNGDIDRFWNRYAPVLPDGEEMTPAQLEQCFLFARYAAMEEYLGILQTQIDQQTGDVKRSYSQQFQQASERFARFAAERNAYVSPLVPGAAAPAGAVALAHLTNTTPNGLAYGQFAGDGRGGYR